MDPRDRLEEADRYAGRRPASSVFLRCGVDPRCGIFIDGYLRRGATELFFQALDTRSEGPRVILRGLPVAMGLQQPKVVFDELRHGGPMALGKAFGLLFQIVIEPEGKFGFHGVTMSVRQDA